MDRDVAILLERSNITTHPKAPAMFTQGNQSVICRIIDGINPSSDYGLVVYSDKNGQVKCCSYFINSACLPDAAREAEILEYLFDHLYATHGWTLEAWGRTLSIHSTLWGNSVALVGNYPVANFRCGVKNSSAISNLVFTVTADSNLQAIIQRAIESSGYVGNVGVAVGSEDRFEIIPRLAPITNLRPGVYLTTAMGKEHAAQLFDRSIQDYQVCVITFPIDTKILTSQYLDGLFADAYVSCPSATVFLQRYKLVGVNAAEARLLQWARSKTKWELQ